MTALRPIAGAARAGGFTLIEVMVALVIVALGMSALLEALSVSAGNISALRDKTVAEWIAMNKIADARLALNAPAIGTTEGDIADCAHGTWHWRQDISAVAAIPGLVNITVSVRRTGNSVTKPSTTSNSRRGLGAPSSLGATGPLGSVQNIGASGCIADASPGSSLGGTPALGAPGTLGAPAALNTSPTLGSSSPAPGALGGLGTGQSGSAAGVNGAAAAAGSALGSSNAAGSLSGGTANTASGNSSASGSDSRSSFGGNWLVTLTGFRGNSIAAAQGESPTWAYSAFAGVSGSSNQTGNGNSGGFAGNGTLGNPPSLGPTTPPGNGAPGSTQSPPAPGLQ